MQNWILFTPNIDTARHLYRNNQFTWCHPDDCSSWWCVTAKL